MKSKGFVTPLKAFCSSPVALAIYFDGAVARAAGQEITRGYHLKKDKKDQRLLGLARKPRSPR